MMIVSRETMIKELKSSSPAWNNMVQRANLAILLANDFMDQAFKILYDPKFLLDKKKYTQEQLKTYSEIYDSSKELSRKLDILSKTSTRYVQDYTF